MKPRPADFSPTALGRPRAPGPWWSLPSLAGVGIIATVVLVGGWYGGHPLITNVRADWPTMKPNTAAGFILLAGAFFLLWRTDLRVARLLATGAASIVMAVTLLTLVQYFAGWDFGLDELLVQARTDPKEGDVYRMSPATAFCFVLASASALVASLAHSPARGPTLQGLGVAVALIAVFTLSGFASGALLFPRIWDYPGMAIHTAVCFLVLGTNIVGLAARAALPGWWLPPMTAAGFAAGLALMVLAVHIAYSSIQALMHTSGWVAHRQEVLRELQVIEGEGAAGLASAQGYLLTGHDPRPDGGAGRRTTKRDAYERLRSLTSDNPVQQRRLDQLRPVLERFFAWEEGIWRGAVGAPAAAADEGTALWAEALALLDAMEREEYSLLAGDKERAQRASLSAFLLLPLGFFLGFSMVALSVAFLNQGAGSQRQAEAALRDNEARMVGIVTSAMDAIVTVDEEQRVQLFNAAAERMFRISAEEIAGERIERLIPERFRGGHAAQVRAFGQRGETARSMGSLGALSAVRADGEEFPVEASISHVEVAGRRLYTVILRDVTERRRAEEQIRELNATLEARVQRRTAELELVNRELDTFCYSVSHDLRAPLRAIGGFAALLEDQNRGTLDETARDYLQRVLGGVERMGELIDDLLQLSRISRNELRFTDVDLSGMAGSIVQALRLAEPGRTVQVEIAPDLRVHGDPRLLRILLENLFSNAWKFTSRVADAHVAFDAEHRPNGEVVFRVRDNGAGFDMRYASKLFAPFQRLHGAREFPGTGIGLATAQRVVHRHQGKIWAESAVDQGTTLFFSFPTPTPNDPLT